MERTLVGAKPRARPALRVLGSRVCRRTEVDPFGLFPCPCAELWVHTTSGARLGDDLVECREHAVVATLKDLFEHLRPPV